MQTTRRSAGVLAAFAAPCVPLAALGLPLVVYLPEYYANELGLGLATVGAIFTWVRLVDVVFDPVIGAVMDRTRTRFGRFKPWLAIGGPLLFLSTLMLFFAQPGVSSLRLWIWLPMSYAAYSICVLSQTAWGSLLSEDYNQRSRVYGWWQSLNMVGILLALLLAALPLLAPAIAEAGRSASVQAMGWFILVTTPLCFGLALWKAPEPAAPVAIHATSWRDYAGLFANAAVRRIVGVDLLIGIALGIIAALFFFFFERVKGMSQAITGVLLLLYFVSALAFAPLWAHLARKLDKHRATALAAAATGLAQVAVLLCPPNNILATAAVIVLAGVPYSAAALLLRAMMADAGDELRLKTGVDRTGLLYALVACTTKFGSALAVGITFPLLSAAGFHARGDGDPSQGLQMLTVLYIAAPVVLCALATIMMLGYRLGPQRHGEILAALEARNANG